MNDLKKYEQRYTFTFESEGRKISSQFEAVTLQEILCEVESFLKGCGFSFKGALDIIEETQENEG